MGLFKAVTVGKELISINSMLQEYSDTLTGGEYTQLNIERVQDERQFCFFVEMSIPLGAAKKSDEGKR